MRPIHMWFTQTTDWMSVPTAIFHATSDDGLDWVIDEEPVLVVGDDRSWDSGLITPDTAIAKDDGVALYYSGGTNHLEFAPTATGLATSPDTSVFTKESEPVITGRLYWDGRLAWEAAIFPYEDGYGALYTGDPKTLTGETIGYARSQDGVTWESASDNPSLKPRAQAWAALDVVAGSVVEMPDGRFLLYYSGNTSGLDFSIGVAELIPAY